MYKLLYFHSPFPNSNPLDIQLIFVSQYPLAHVCPCIISHHAGLAMSKPPNTEDIYCLKQHDICFAEDVFLFIKTSKQILEVDLF